MGSNIGDPLTDNKETEDDYRFHDVFHFANAAVLGWSPVIRALFKVKRKSRPRVDETQDGARAILIEEGIGDMGVQSWRTGWIISKNIKNLDYSLLKAIRETCDRYMKSRAGHCGSGRRPSCQGYGVFRQLRKNRGGVFVADLVARTISYQDE